MKSWISWYLSPMDAAEERRIGAVYALHDILQHRGVDVGMRRHRLLDTGQLGLLLVAGDRDSAGAPGFPARANGGVVDVTAERQQTPKHPLLCRSRFEFVLVRLVDALPFHT
jgi:hypothetical protein